MLTKNDIARKLADEGLTSSIAAATEIVSGVFDAIKTELTDGGKASIHGFGTFSVKNVDEKTGKIPGTEKTYTKAAHKKAAWKPAPALKTF